MKTALKSLLLASVLAATGTTSALAQIALSANHNGWQRTVSYRTARTDDPTSCATQWINLAYAFRHCEEQLFSGDIPGVGDCSAYCD
jgi:hypothetical protein